MPRLITPDVYIEEISVFPPSVAEVETAIPAFIGYTEKATEDVDNDLILRPTKIYLVYGVSSSTSAGRKRRNSPVTATADGGEALRCRRTERRASPLSFLLYFAVKMFFDNGGGKCYIVSVGATRRRRVRDTAELTNGLGSTWPEDEPTLLVIPEAVKLSPATTRTLASGHARSNANLEDRFAILDVYARRVADPDRD